MATLPDMALQVIEASWQLALGFIPLLYFAFLGDAMGSDNEGNLVETVVWGQRGYTLHYGVYTVGGLIAGAFPVMVLGGQTGMFVGGAFAASATGYGYIKTENPTFTALDLGTWRGRLAAPWIVVPVLAAAALATGSLLLKSIVALVFLSAVFWEV